MDGGGDGLEIDSRLKDVVERMFKRCLDDGEFKQAIGIAVESRRLDIVEKAVQSGVDRHELCIYTMDVSMTLVQNLNFRNQVCVLSLEASCAGTPFVWKLKFLDAKVVGEVV